MAKRKTIDEIFEENAEASPKKGVQQKGTAPPPRGKVKVTYQSKGLALNLLDKVQLMYITTAGVVGEYLIFVEFTDPWRAHAMWAFGIATAVSSLSCFLRKRE